MRNGRRGRRVGGLAAVGAAMLMAGCGSGLTPLSRPTPLTLPAGSPLTIPTLAVGDAWLRHHLLLGAADSALSLFAPDRESPVGDDLLSALQRAILLREAGDLGASNELLEWADVEAERRHVRSASRTAASFLVNDRVLEYTPTPSELAMIPFYRLLNYLELGDTAEAAVEARRISALLERRGVGAGDRCPGDGMLHHIAGLAFEAAGEIAHAAVSLRQADASFRACDGSRVTPGLGRDLVRVAGMAGLTEVADSARSRYPQAAVAADSAADPRGQGRGELIVLVERGFVAHRTPEALHVPVYDDELNGVDGEDADAVGRIALEVTARLANNFAERERWGSAWDDEPGIQVGHALSGAHVLRLAWPSLVRPAYEWPALRLQAGERTADAAAAIDLSSMALADLDHERPAMLARLVARSLSKFLIARELERKAEEEGGELLGFITGRLANLAANELERPDTRSWTLLPDRIEMVRIAVPAGANEAHLEVGEGDAIRIDLAPLGTPAAGRRILSVRAYDREVKAPAADT